MSDESYLPVVQQQISVANDFLRGKYKLKGLQQKLLDIGIARIQSDVTGKMTAKISAAEIREITGLTGGGLYTQLKDLAQAIQNQRILITNKESRSFESYVIIPTAVYKDGDLTLVFNEDMARGRLYEVQAPYTRLRIDVLNDLPFYASRLYRILKSYAHYPLKKGKRVVDVEYGVSELKFELGIYDPEMIINIPTGQKETAAGKIRTIYRKATISSEISKGHIDWDEAISYIEKKDHHFDDWYSFKSRILLPACRDISDNIKSDLICDLEPKKAGRGGKVVGVVFHVRKDPNYVPTPLLKDEKNIIISQLQALMEDEDLNVNDLMKICDSGGWDYQFIEDTYYLAKKQAYIENFVAWMRAALRDRYVEQTPVETMQGRTQEQIRHLNELREEKIDPVRKREIDERIRNHESVVRERVPEEIIVEEEDIIVRDVEVSPKAETINYEEEIGRIMADQSLSVARRMELIAEIQKQMEGVS